MHEIPIRKALLTYAGHALTNSVKSSKDSDCTESIMNQHFPLQVAILTMIFTSLLLSACASNNKQAKSLDETLKQYEIVIRWSQWDAAADYLSIDYLTNHPISRLDMDRLHLFKVTQYVIRSAIPFDEGLAMRQVVQIKLFNRNRVVERTLIDQQEWRYDIESERWFLHSGLPDVTKAR